MDKFGFPSKKKTMIAHGRRGFYEGSLLEATKKSLAAKELQEAKDRAGIKPPPENSYWDSVKDVVKRKFTPNIAETMQAHEARTKRAIDEAGGTDIQEPVEGKKRGGVIKSKPRGVGIAKRGHGKVGRK